ncbi:hypothetical protein D3C71_1376300 [compost metagenome]
MQIALLCAHHLERFDSVWGDTEWLSCFENRLEQRFDVANRNRDIVSGLTSEACPEYTHWNPLDNAGSEMHMRERVCLEVDIGLQLLDDRSSFWAGYGNVAPLGSDVVYEYLAIRPVVL